MFYKVWKFGIKAIPVTGVQIISGDHHEIVGVSRVLFVFSVIPSDNFQSSEA